MVMKNELGCLDPHHRLNFGSHSSFSHSTRIRHFWFLIFVGRSKRERERERELKGSSALFKHIEEL